MNPAEEIVKFWLQQNGYFVQSSLRAGGGKEVDILAIHKDHPNDKKHIEVSVSLRMADYKNTPKTRARKFYEDKFIHPKIQREIEKENRFGKNVKYKRELVVGDVTLKGKDALKELTKECHKKHIEVIHISTILNDIVPNLGNETRLNSIIKTVQLCKKFMPRIETKV